MPPARLDFAQILKTLCGHQVDFIIVGGVGAVLQGAPISTFDLDLVHRLAEDNIERLVAALASLDATHRDPAGRDIRPDASRLATPGHQLLMTSSGPLDLLGRVGRNSRYEDLLDDAVELEIEPGLTVQVLDLERLIELKEEAGRDKDRAVLPVLRQTLTERGKR